MNLLHTQLHDILPVDLETDLIIVDYGVNDAVLELFDFSTRNVELSHEILVRYVMNDMIRRPALLYVESFINPTKAKNNPHQAMNMAAVHRNVTQQYGIPMTSFRDAVWPDFDDSALALSLWGDSTHPPWQTHQLLADVTAYFLEKSLSRFFQIHGTLEDPTPREREFLNFKQATGCLEDERAFSIETKRYAGKAPPDELVSSSGWYFMSSSLGHDGFVGFGNSSTKAIASWKLPCAGQRQRLDIGYLRSYENMGALKVDVNRKGNPLGTTTIIDGMWESHASVEVFQVIPIPDGNGIVTVNFEVLSSDMEGFYDEVLSSTAVTENGVVVGTARADRKFKVSVLQCC